MTVLDVDRGANRHGTRPGHECRRCRSGQDCYLNVVPVAEAHDSADRLTRLGSECLELVCDLVDADAGGWSRLDRHGVPTGLIAYPRRSTIDEMVHDHGEYFHQWLKADPLVASAGPAVEVTATALMKSEAAATPHRLGAPYRAVLHFTHIGRPVAGMWVVRGSDLGEFDSNELRTLWRLQEFVQRQLDEVLAERGFRSIDALDMSESELTEREVEVARLAATGATNVEIARTLMVSVATVKTHLYRVFTKLDIRSRTELAVRFQRREAV